MLGTSYLFGNIIGFGWVRSPTEVVALDIRGNVVGLKEQVTRHGVGRLRIGSESISG
jgi:hypothetical protein